MELTAARGVPTQVVDATHLPFEDNSFDLVAAMWMLYHVPDLERTLTEVRGEDVRSRAVFADHAAAVAYLESSQEDVAWDLPAFDGPRTYLGEGTVFLASFSQ